MGAPSPEVIHELKAKFPERSLHLVEAVDGETTHHFVMTGPSRDEHKKFTDEMLAAKDQKDEAAKIAALRAAIERAALAQIRWPARDDVQRLFDYKPEMLDGLADTLRQHAGAETEFRTKKL